MPDFEPAVMEGFDDRGDCLSEDESAWIMDGFVNNDGGFSEPYVPGVDGAVEVGDIQSDGGKPALDRSENEWPVL